MHKRQQVIVQNTYKFALRRITPKKRWKWEGYHEIYPKNGSLPGNNVRVRMYECIEYSFQLSNLKIFQKSILKFFSVFATCFVPRIRCLSATNELKTHFQTISFV